MKIGSATHHPVRFAEALKAEKPNKGLRAFFLCDSIVNLEPKGNICCLTPRKHLF